jgi:hypothetical protein
LLIAVNIATLRPMPFCQLKRRGKRRIYREFSDRPRKSNESTQIFRMGLQALRMRIIPAGR